MRSSVKSRCYLEKRNSVQLGKREKHPGLTHSLILSNVAFSRTVGSRGTSSGGQEGTVDKSEITQVPSS